MKPKDVLPEYKILSEENLRGGAGKKQILSLPH
jgi:hypothetical protein